MPGSIPVRSMRARRTVAPSSVGVTSLSAPPYRPTAVRSGSQMTASCMLCSLASLDDRLELAGKQGGQARSGAEQDRTRPGPLEVQVRVVLPGEAYAATQLDGLGG